MFKETIQEFEQREQSWMCPMCLMETKGHVNVKNSDTNMLTCSNIYLQDFNMKPTQKMQTRWKKSVKYKYYIGPSTTKSTQKDEEFNSDHQPKYRVKNKKKYYKNKNLYAQICMELQKILRNNNAKTEYYSGLTNKTKEHLYKVLRQKQLQQYLSEIFLSKKLIRAIQLGDCSLMAKLQNIKEVKKLSKFFILPLWHLRLQIVPTQNLSLG